MRHEQVAAHAADGYARADRQARLRRDHRRPRLHQRHDRDRLRLPRRDPDPAHRRPGRAHPAQDGLAAGPAARRHDGADHQVRGHRALHRARRRHGQHGGARVLQRRVGAVVPRDPARRAGPRGRALEGGHPRPRALPGLDPLDRRSRRHREAGRPAGERRAALHPARHPGVELPRSRAGDRAGPPAQHPGLLQRLGPRPAAARRSRITSTAPAASRSTRPT